MGLTQHKAAVATIQEIVNFLLLRGSIGKPGAGACPVRGHSNVQGDRTMGIYEKPSDQFLDRLEAEFGFDPPREHGYDTVDAIRAMRDGEVDVFFSMGGNFVAAAPDTDATAAALVPLPAHRAGVDEAQPVPRARRPGRADPPLPRAHRARRHRRAPAVRQRRGLDGHGARHVRREPAGLGAPAQRGRRSCARSARRRSATRHGIDWAGMARDYDRIRDHMQRVVPGFDDFNARVRVPGGFTLPNAARDSRTFATASGKAELTVNTFEPIEVPEGRLLLQTVRSHDQYNTTIYGLDDRYRGISQGRRVVFVRPDDIATLGLADGQMVDIVSEWRDGTERRAPSFRVVGYPVAAGTCAAYFPEANVLVPLDSTADRSGTPTSKSVVVRFEPI